MNALTFPGEFLSGYYMYEVINIGLAVVVGLPLVYLGRIRGKRRALLKAMIVLYLVLLLMGMPTVIETVALGCIASASLCGAVSTVAAMAFLKFTLVMMGTYLVFKK